MNRTVLPAPPDPTTGVYSGNPNAWMRAATDWMRQVKGRIETDSTINTQPIGPLVVSTYTAVTTMTGTDATSNALATLITLLTEKGLISPTQQRTT